MDEGQKLARLALEFPELSAAECGAALQAQAGNLAAAVAILDMHVSAVRTCGTFGGNQLSGCTLLCLVRRLLRVPLLQGGRIHQLGSKFLHANVAMQSPTLYFHAAGQCANQPGRS
jgi:hypothetical protein